MRPGLGIFTVFLVAQLAGCIVEGASLGEVMSSTTSPDAGYTTASSANNGMSSTDDYDTTQITFQDEPVYEPSQSTTGASSDTSDANPESSPDTYTDEPSDTSPCTDVELCGNEQNQTAVPPYEVLVLLYRQSVSLCPALSSIFDDSGLVPIFSPPEIEFQPSNPSTPEEQFTPTDQSFIYPDLSFPTSEQPYPPSEQSFLHEEHFLPFQDLTQIVHK